MSDKSSEYRLSIKKVFKKEVKDIPPPSPPEHKYIAIKLVTEENSFSYENLISYFNKYKKINC